VPRAAGEDAGKRDERHSPSDAATPTVEYPTLHVIHLAPVFLSTGSRASCFDPIGGMQVQVARLVASLHRRGIEQTVVTSYRPGAQRIEHVALLRVFRLGVPVVHCRQFYAVPALVMTTALAGRADVIHVHTGFDLAAVPIGVTAGRLHRRPIVLTLHVGLHHRSRSALSHPIFCRAGPAALQLWGAAHVDAVVAFSKRTRCALIAGGIPAERVHRLTPIVPPSTLSGVDVLPELPRPRIVFVGRISPEKGVETLIDAVALMRTVTPTLIIVGDGPNRRAAERRSAARGLAHAIHFTGFVAPDVVPSILQHADVVALPSTYEELGVVLWEAMANAVPVVASDVGGIPDLVDDGRTGLLVPPGQAPPLARALERVLADPSFARTLGTEAQRRVSGRGLAAVESTLGLYRVACRSGPATSRN
jgi:glycogen(starch) synthase